MEKKTLEELFDEADRTGSVDLGVRVFCDLCAKEWTGRPESGGFLFGSKAVCPDCAPDFLIKAYCPVGQPYRTWTLSLLNGDDTIKVIKR